MKIFPAIDLYGGKAVRLYKGDYNQMTVYSDNPVEIALDFKDKGAKYMHLVDLEGAKTGETPNIETVKKLISATDTFVEVGGGIRSIEVIEKYVDAGVGRVILGTKALSDEQFLIDAVKRFKEKIAVGVDTKDGFVAIKGWTETSSVKGVDFCKKLEQIGVKTVIYTDVSKDGAMQGTNIELYKTLKTQLNLDIVASGGVSSIDDIKALSKIGVYGAIIGKAYYTKAIDLQEAIGVANDN